VRALVDEARAAGRVAVSLVRDQRVPMRSRVAGVGLSHAAGQAAYVPVNASPLELPGAAPREQVLGWLRPLLEDPAVGKVSPRAKYDRLLLAREGLGYEGVSFDVLLAEYMLNPGRRSPNLEDLALEVLGERPAPTPGTSEGAIQTPSLDAVSRAAAQEADLTLRVADPLAARLREEGLDEAFATLELPLTQVLSEMEQGGVKVDVALLQAMSRDMERQIDELTREIHALAKGPFNINSPVQLRDVLFERLSLKAGKKTAKTRASSTAEEVLEELALVHDLPRKILDYRGVQKLKSTYVDALPALVNPETGRIHACFHQTVASTGRISVTDPNLQNIPIRTAEGRRIREAFVAEPGHLLLSADYSQIELRILAHLSKDATLVDTFRRGEDIHDRTSREIFGAFSILSPEEQRRRSKMVNYALLYGKTAFTLAKDIGVSKKEAEDFIQAYFARYPSVRNFIEQTIARARETGYVRTLLGRLRRLPDLKAKNFQVRMEAERQAMNTPVQGSAADLIKKAMIDLRQELRERKMASRLILQIHDELLLEVPESEAEVARGLVRAIMEGALQLEVPLVAEARLGKNWAEVH
jgi:DNA polymerase-1